MDPNARLKPRPGDELLDKPPPGVVITLSGLAKHHWSELIVEDRRPDPAVAAADAENARAQQERAASPDGMTASERAMS